jgi:myo-inositol 2-dehydrogenase / D-chiro-inositol 1-dehydrogenase
MPVRIGFVGAGGIAGAHMNALEKVNNAKIVAFADVDEARARKAAERFGATAYTDYKEMFEREELQAVYVCVPPFAHTDAEILAAERKLALFVEKPVASTMAKAKEIAAAIEASGVVAAVGYHWRAYDLTARVKQELEGKPVGLVMGYWMGGLPGVWWWRKMETSCGQMVEQTTHIVDLARYLVGDVKRVYAAYGLRALQGTPDLDVPDVGTMTLHFENGAVGHIANTCLLKMGYTTGLNIVTPELVVEHRAGNVKLIRPTETLELRTQVNPTVVEDQAFVDAVQAGSPAGIYSTYADAVKSLAVSLAANVSAERGTPVEVAELL